MYPGQTHRLRRNLLNFVLVADLGSTDGLAAAAAAHALFQQNLPIRWGILPANTSLRIRAFLANPHCAVKTMSSSLIYAPPGRLTWNKPLTKFCNVPTL
jgi:hypothetical protein